MKRKDPDKSGVIFKATLRLVREGGLSGLTMAAIGKEAGLGMGTLYTYFPGKEDLILSLYKRLKNSNTARIYAGIRPDQAFVSNLKILVSNYLQNRIDHFDEHFFVEQCAHSHYMDEEARLMENNAFYNVNELLQQGKQQMLVKNMENMLLIAQMMGACNEIVQMLLKQQIPLTEAITDEVFTMCWDSIKR